MALFRVSRAKPNREALAFYRACLRVIGQLEPEHKKIWYDYTRLKYAENLNLQNGQKLQRILEESREELEWVKSVLSRKDAFRKPRPNPFS